MTDPKIIMYDEATTLDEFWETASEAEKRRANDLFLLDVLERNFQNSQRFAHPGDGRQPTRAERRRARRR